MKSSDEGIWKRVQAGLSGKCHSLEVREGTAKTLRIVIWLHIAGSAMHMGIEEGRNGLRGQNAEPGHGDHKYWVVKWLGLSSGSAEPGTCCAECCARHYGKALPP